MNTFRRGLALPQAPEEVFGWHLRPGAPERLLPPWGGVRIVKETGDIAGGGHVHLQWRRGLFRRSWALRHTSQVLSPPVWRFRDVLERGPLAHWVHTHRVRKAQTGALLEDEIEWILPGGGAGQVLAGARVQAGLDRLFRHRHRRLQVDLAAHARWSGQRRRVLVTGASGLIGRQLVAFLASGGHDVVRGVRGLAGPGEVQWLPAPEPRTLAGFDAVVHLAGESVSQRWSTGARARMRASRVDATRTLAQALAASGAPPPVFLSASAIGIYGDRGDSVLDEAAAPSTDGFLAPLTAAWEAAADPLRAAGGRVVNLRLGVVLEPRGGALGQLVPVFRWGLGGPVGGGRQWLSWIHLDDALRAILACIDGELSGPVNVVTPRPVQGRAFAAGLGRALGRPALVPVPGPALIATYGAMARETLLASTRVTPARLQDAGFTFAYPSLDGALQDLLGT